MNDKRSSYTAASALPTKLIKMGGGAVNNSPGGGGIRPIHPQISPTNKCNLHCKFCSCADRDQRAEIPRKEILAILGNLSILGARALTITGGGEPLLYPHIDEFIHTAKDTYGMEIGLVTNGILLPKTPVETLNKLTWCRISCSDDRDLYFLHGIADVVRDVPNVDWAFSYVVTVKPNFDNIAQVIKTAGILGMTHIRMVTDLLDLNNAAGMRRIETILKTEYPQLDLSRVIFQGRKQYEHGAKRCLIPLLKPLIASDGKVYPCCGVQYARENASLNFDPTMNMGSLTGKMWRNQDSFDGGQCVRCYYGDYNRVLAAMVDPIEHGVFL